MILCLGIAAIAAEIGLAAVIGAFLAGMIVAETKEQHPIEEEIAPLYAFFPPFFFASIGLDLDLDSLVEPRRCWSIAGLTALAAVTKLAVPGPAPARWPRTSADRRARHGPARRGRDHRRRDRRRRRGHRHRAVRGDRRHVDPDHLIVPPFLRACDARPGPPTR